VPESPEGRTTNRGTSYQNLLHKAPLLMPSTHCSGSQSGPSGPPHSRRPPFVVGLSCLAAFTTYWAAAAGEGGEDTLSWVFAGPVVMCLDIAAMSPLTFDCDGE
jgi:hypothetical protein